MKLRHSIHDTRYTTHDTHLAILVARFLLALFFPLQLHLQQRAVRQLRLARGRAAPIHGVQLSLQHERVHKLLFVRYTRSTSGGSSGERRLSRRPSLVRRPAVGVTVDAAAQIDLRRVDMLIFTHEEIGR